MILTLQRDPPTHISTPGQLFGDTGRLAYTLERHPGDPEHPSIPEGTYPVTMLKSSKFGTLLPHVLNVPGREAIEIHCGNFPRDTEGCILVGNERGEDYVGESRVAVSRVIAWLETSSGPHKLTVLDP